MAPVQLKYVVSFTSQDDIHKANNLLSDDENTKWLSHPKDRSGKIEIVFQLEEPCRFSYIDVGTLWCANLEIRVGRSDWPLTEEYKVLVPMVNLMSPIDCHLGRKTSSTNMFSKNNFSDVTASQAWDRIQILCRQPFRKDSQLGISFVRIRNSDMSSKTKPENNCGSEKTLPVRSVSSIQKHFFGESKENDDDYTDSLKYKLLQMSNSTDNGSDVVHEQALSRTAQLVLKASEISQTSSKHYKILSKHTKRGLFSGSIVGKDHVKINEEIASFLPTLNIQLSQLDSITIADLRHRFERSKKRKLQPEEKRVFSSECQSFICNLVEQKNGTEKTRDVSGQDSQVPLRLTPSTTNSKSSFDKSSPHDVNKTGKIPVKAICKESLSVSHQNTRTENLSKNSPSTCPSPLRSPSVQKNAKHYTPSKQSLNGTLSPCNKTKTQENMIRNCPNVKESRALCSAQSPSSCEFKRTTCCQGNPIVNMSKLKPDKSNKSRTSIGKEADKDKRTKSDYNEVISESEDDILCESSTSCDDEDDDIKSISKQNTSSLVRKSQELRNRTVEQVNEAYANLYKSNPPLTAQRDGTSGNKQSGRKRKQLSKESIDLISSFQSELSDDEGTSSSGNKSTSSPWLSKHGICQSKAASETKNGWPWDGDVVKTGNSKKNKTLTVVHSKSSPSNRDGFLKKTGHFPGATKTYSESSSPHPGTSLTFNVMSASSPTNWNKNAEGTIQRQINGKVTEDLTRNDVQPFMRTCPSCDILMPSETFFAHYASCIKRPDTIQAVSRDATLDENEEFRECPICFQQIPTDVLLFHASECGL